MLSESCPESLSSFLLEQFQLSEQAASAVSRIQGIARAAAEGNLEPGPDSWLTSQKDRYYRTNTEIDYMRLLPPAGCYATA